MTATNQAVDSQQWRLSLGHVIRSEYLKLVTLRSLRWTFVITLILLVGSNLWAAILVQPEDDPAQLRFVLAGTVVAELTALVLGVLYVTNEYSSGMVKLTFSGVPRRNTVVAAKVIVLGVVGFVVYAIAEFVSFFLSSAIVTAKATEISFATEGVFAALVGQVVVLTFMTLLGSFLGWIFRSTALSIVIGFALLFSSYALFLLSLTPLIPQVVGEYAPATLFLTTLSGFPLVPSLTLLELSIAAVTYLAVLWIIAAAVVSRRDV